MTVTLTAADLAVVDGRITNLRSGLPLGPVVMLSPRVCLVMNEIETAPAFSFNVSELDGDGKVGLAIVAGHNRQLDEDLLAAMAGSAIGDKFRLYPRRASPKMRFDLVSRPYGFECDAALVGGSLDNNVVDGRRRFTFRRWGRTFSGDQHAESDFVVVARVA